MEYHTSLTVSESQALLFRCTAELHLHDPSLSPLCFQEHPGPIFLQVQQGVSASSPGIWTLDYIMCSFNSEPTHLYWASCPCCTTMPASPSAWWLNEGGKEGRREGRSIHCFLSLKIVFWQPYIIYPCPILLCLKCHLIRRYLFLSLGGDGNSQHMVRVPPRQLIISVALV